MFWNCKGLITLNLSNFDTKNITDMRGMFWECNSLKILDLSNFDTRNVTDMSGLFYNCSNLTTIYASDKFVTTKVPDSDSIFNNCTKLVGGNGTKYSSSFINKTYARIDKVGTKGYFTAKVSTGEIIAESITWSNGTATVKLKSTGGGTIEYQKGSSGTWKPGTSVTGLKHGDVVYARLTDGSAETAINIIDDIPPEITITLGEVTSDSIQITVSAIDRESGMPTIPRYTYNIRRSGGLFPLGTPEPITETNHTFSNQGIEADTSYEILVTTTDVAGNEGEEWITVTTNTGIDYTKQIPFTINGISCAAYEGMNWIEWINEGPIKPNNQIMDEYGFICSCQSFSQHTGTPLKHFTSQIYDQYGGTVYCTDKIKANYRYST